MKACKQCGKRIPARMIVNGIRRNLKGRKYCFECSPFGQHNTTQLDGRKQKQCKECGKTFCTQRQTSCPACNYQRRRDIREKKIYSITGTDCWYCGYDRGYEARAVLEFHHVNSETKKFNVSSREIATLKWDKVITEAKKCVLLCARCHREEQIGIIKKEEIDKIYKEKWDTIIVDTTVPIIIRRQKIAKICPICAKAHFRKTYCSLKCAMKSRRKFEINKEMLEKLIQEKTYEAIGREYNVSGNAVKKRCRLFGLV